MSSISSIWLPGEALFVPRGAAAGDEDEGYLLTVASHRDKERSSCWTLDAKTMQMRARLAVNTLIPLGFHGQFIRGLYQRENLIFMRAGVPGPVHKR